MLPLMDSMYRQEFVLRSDEVAKKEDIPTSSTIITTEQDTSCVITNNT